MPRRDDGSAGSTVPALVAAVTAISFAAIFFRKAAPTHPLVAAGVRLLVAAVLLAPLVARARRAGRLPTAVIRSAVLGGFAYAVHFGTWVTSLTMTTVAASVTLVTATPVVLAVVGILRHKDAPERRHWLALVLAAAGLALIGGADLANQEALLGDGLALVGALAMAGYMLIARRHERRLDSWAYSGIACAVGSAVLLLMALGLGVPIVFGGWEPLGFVVLAALFPQLVGHGLLTWSLRYARPTVVAFATLAEPAGSTLLAWLWLGERAGALTLLGCVITIAAVAFAVWRPAPAVPKPRSPT
ncbi:MAG TPA: DMT family transporter [Polyangiaceae bacterium]|nr:DMT family transporter [Polyangiaceae bacterium]